MVRVWTLAMTKSVSSWLWTPFTPFTDLFFSSLRIFRSCFFNSFLFLFERFLFCCFCCRLASLSWTFLAPPLPTAALLAALLAALSPNILEPVPPGAQILDLAKLTASLTTKQNKKSINYFETSKRNHYGGLIHDENNQNYPNGKGKGEANETSETNDEGDPIEYSVLWSSYIDQVINSRGHTVSIHF